MPTQDMRLPTAANARNVARNVEDLYNSALLDRIIEDGALPSEKIEGGATALYIATITQAGANPPTVTEVLNTTGATVTPARGGAGAYTLTFSANVLTVGGTMVMLEPGTGADLAQVAKAYVTGANQIGILTGSDSTTAADGELTNALLVVQVLA